MARAPHPHLAEVADEPQGLEVTARLYPASKDCQDGGVWSRQVLCRNGGDGRRADLGDESPIHGDKRLTGFWTEQLDDCMVRWYHGVLRVKGHELGPQGRTRV